MQIEDRDKIDNLRSTSPESFIEIASSFYGMTKESLTKFLGYYRVEPKTSEEPLDNDTVILSLREIAEYVDLPVKVVGRLQDIKIIGSPITVEDMLFMQAYRKSWGNTFLMKCQLANLSIKQREELMVRPELSSKWERWVYSRYLYNEIEYGAEGLMLTPHNRIIIDRIADDIENLFHVPKTQKVLKRIKKIREMAYNDRKKIGIDPYCEKEILMRRTKFNNRVDLETESYVFDMYS